MHLTLKLMNGEVLEETVDEPVITIGRSPKCTVVVPHEGMSRQHCQIENVNGEIFITDLGSTNGVLIDNERIEPHRRIPYQTFLTLSFGAVQSLILELEDPHQKETNNSALQVKGPALDSVTKTSKTKTMATTQKAEKNDFSQKNKGSSKTIEKNSFQSMFVNILALLILAGAVFWYIQKDDATEASGDISPINPDVDISSPKPKEKNFDQF